MYNFRARKFYYLFLLGILFWLLSSCNLVELIQPQETEDATCPSERFRFAIARVDTGKAVLFGGTANDADSYNDTWQFTRSDNNWAELQISDPIPEIRMEHAFAYAGSGKAVLFGGTEAMDSHYHTGIWEYDSVNRTWQKYETGIICAKVAALAYAGESKVLIYGGWGQTGDIETYEYNTADHSFIRVTGNINSPPHRGCHAMAFG